MTTAATGNVRINTAVETGKWIRQPGSDIAKGQRVLSAGEVLSAAEMGILATVGVTKIEVEAQPVVGVLSTGDELVRKRAAKQTAGG